MFERELISIRSLTFLSWQDRANLIFVLFGLKPTASFIIDSRVIPENRSVDLRGLNGKVLRVSDKYIDFLKNRLDLAGFRYNIVRDVLSLRNREGLFKGWSFSYELVTFNVGRSVVSGSHELTGLSFGYPECCSRAYSRIPELLRNVPLILGLLVKAGVEFPRRVYLINHVPCVYPFCDRTLKQVISYEEVLLKYAPDIYHEFIKHYEELMETEVSQASVYLRKYIRGSKRAFMRYRKFFSSDSVFNKLFNYLVRAGFLR